MTSELPIIWPLAIIFTGVWISISPFEIFVWMFNAWKNEVPSGVIGVIPEGIITSFGDNCPAFAGAGTLLFSNISLILTASIVVKMKPTFPDKYWKSSANSGFFFVCSFKTFFTILFFPNIKIESFPNAFLHFLNWFELIFWMLTRTIRE